MLPWPNPVQGNFFGSEWAATELQLQRVRVSDLPLPVPGEVATASGMGSVVSGLQAHEAALSFQAHGTMSSEMEARWSSGTAEMEDAIVNCSGDGQTNVNSTLPYEQGRDLAGGRDGLVVSRIGVLPH